MRSGALFVLAGVSLAAGGAAAADPLVFQRIQVDPDPPERPYVKLAGDVNGDGRLDIAIGGAKGPLAWYSNPEWRKVEIAQGGWQTVGGAVGDVDGDGDPDIVPGSQIWFENPRPAGDPARDPWPAHRISDVRSHDALLADLDRDGRLDLVARDQSGFNHNAGNRVHFWRQAARDRWEHHAVECPHGEGLAVADMDRDGDPDVILGGRWLENPGRVAADWPQHVYTTRWEWADAKVALGDLNRDGRIDIALAPAEYKGQTYRLAWYEAPENPRQGEWPERVVVPEIEAVIHSLQAADMNGDGRLDLAAAHMHQGAPPQDVFVLLNQDNGLHWMRHVVSQRGSHDILVADFDGNGRPDILGANHSGAYQPVELWRNQPGSIGLQPYPIDWARAAQSVVDMSRYLQAPAGQGGLIRVEGAHLVKPDGSRLRIWGVNLTGPECFPPKELAALIADDLARFGVNCVRFHHMDGTWSPLFDKTRDDTARFDSAAIDRLDFFVAQLKSRGIYTNLNLNVSRQYKPGDGVRDAHLLGYGKSSTYFHPRLIELQHDFARQLLMHRNPYTQHEYRHEPAVCTVELVNENSVLEGWVNGRLVGSDTSEGNATWRPIPVSYAAELTDQYNAWLNQHLPPDQLEQLRQEAGSDRVERLAPPQFGKASRLRFFTEARFYSQLERTFFEGMKRLLRDELGVRAPIVGTADHADAYCAYAHIQSNMVLDYIDGHGYWQHPRTGADFWIANTPMVNDPLDATVTQFARTPVVGLPYTISETNHPYPAEYACEGIPILTAYALLHDWDGIYWFTYGKGRMQPATEGWRSSFDFSNDPVKLTHLAACAALFHRQDVDKARQTVVRVYSQEQIIEGLRMDRKERPFFDPQFPRSAALQHATRWTTEGQASALPEAAPLGKIESDTGEIGWYDADKEIGVVCVDTPRTQALIGHVRDGRNRTSQVLAQIDNPFCCIYLTALGSQPIADADRLLLTTTARSTLTGFTWNPDRKTVADWGRAPTVIEPVCGTVTLTGLQNVRGVTIAPLAAEGRPLGPEIPAEKTEQGWRITLGDPVTTWYRVQVQR